MVYRVFIKYSEEELDYLISNIKLDPKHMTLLQILDSQLRQFVHNGKTDFRSFLGRLGTEELLSEQDILLLKRESPFSSVGKIYYRIFNMVLTSKRTR
jgi:hypothetical protein